MITKSRYILIFFLTFVFVSASAQNSQVLYHMNLPQNHLLNPAMRPSNSFYIGLPVLSGINLNVSNNFVNFSDVFQNSPTSDSVYTFLNPKYDVGTFLAKIKKRNFLEPESSVQLFGLGFSAGKDLYMFLDITERMNGNTVIPKDLFSLALLGNENFVGKSIDLSTFRADVKYYREIGFGFSKNFTNKLRIGVRGKVLSGIANASIDNNSFGITVNSDYTHTLDADMIVNLSAPLIVKKNTAGDIESVTFDDSALKTTKGKIDFLKGKKNMGFGIDIGATYDISDKFTVSAAVTDLGYIKWKNNLANFKAESQFKFSGLNMVDVANGSKTFDQLATEMLDSLKNSFNVSDTKDPFTTFLPWGVSFAGNYSLTKNFSLGVLSYTRVISKQVRESLSLSANVNIGNAFSTSVSYTMANRRFDNLGFGMAFRAGVFQFYLMSDRIPVMWNRAKIDKSYVVFPSNWNTVNLRLGMNLVFGNKIKKKDDMPMVLVE
jgi:hypothetical protein